MNIEVEASRSETISPQPRLHDSVELEEEDSPGPVQDQPPSDEAIKQGDAEEYASISSGEEAGTGGAGVLRGTAAVSREALSRVSRRQATPLSMTSLQLSVPASSPVLGHARDLDRWGAEACYGWAEDSSLMGLGYEYAHTRIMPMSSPSCLRPGSRFLGTQQSERQRYDVQVEIKHVDMRESFLCGYLRIQGVSEITFPLRTWTRSCALDLPSWTAIDGCMVAKKPSQCYR